MELTDWYEPHQKPVRSGTFLTEIFDAGWTYDWYVWFDADRGLWLDNENGWALSDQNVTWRGIYANDDR